MKIKAFLFVALCVLFSCQREADDVSSQTQSTEYGVGGEILLEGSLDLSFDMPEGEEEELPRNLSIVSKDNNKDGTIDALSYKIDINKYKNKKMQIFVRKGTGQTVTSVEVPVTITLNNGRYHFGIQVKDLYPKGSKVDFTVGDWYITGYWGGGKQGTEGQHKVANIAPVVPNVAGQNVEMDIPLGFPWTKISAVNKSGKIVMKHENLRIRPLGAIFCLFPENRTKYTVDLQKLDRELEGFAIGGYFDVVGSPVAEGQFPKFSKGFSIATTTQTTAVNVLPNVLRLTSGQKSDKPIYLWAMPTGTSTSDYFMSFTFESTERTTMDASLNAVDRFSTNGVGRFTDRYVFDFSFKRVPQNGNYFIKEMKIKGSPMITEYFMNRVINNTTYRGADGGRSINHPYFYGYVELYNPNLDPITLEHYALCRISNVREVKSGGTYGPNYPYFHPFAAEKFEESGKTGRTGTADRDGDDKTESHRALLLSLKLRDGERSSFQPNSLGIQSPVETGLDYIKENLIPDADNDGRIEHVRFFKGKPADGRAILEGGKTMLILGNGFSHKRKEQVFTYRDDNGTRQTTNSKDNTLAKNADPRITPLPESVYNALLTDSECQMIVSVDNFLLSNTHPGYTGYAAGSDYYSIHSGAGVMNLAWQDALFLVQKHKNKNSRRRVVDATSAHPFARVNNWADFTGKVSYATEYPAGTPHFRVRTVAQRSPEFLNFGYEQWHPALHTSATTLPAKVSPGKRSAAR